MNKFEILYQEKKRTPAEAAALVESNSKLSMGMALGEPPALLKALADRAEAGELDNLKVYYYESTSIVGETLFRYELMDRIHPYCMFVTGVERALIKRGEQDGRKVVTYVPSTFHQASRLLNESIGIDTFIVTVSPMDKHGYFSLGTGNDYASRVARAAKRLIVEVNEHMPNVQGAGAQLHISEVDALVEHHAPLLEFAKREATDADRIIGKTISSLIPDGACLQMGVGALPNFVCSQLVDHRDLGIHSEVLCPGMIDLIERGVVTNRKKTIDKGKTVFTFAMGQKAMYDFIDCNPSVYSRPVDYVNDPHNIALNDKVISVNATIEIDLTGACNSEHMLGHQYSASGGQLDFVRGAYASKGGRSFIACRATAGKEGQISKIVPTLSGPVTTPRTDTHIIVTEFGWADLKGKSSSERALAIINLADPKFRDELMASAKKLHLL